MSVSLGLVIALSVSRLGQGQAREAGTEKSGVSGISLSRADGSISHLTIAARRWQCPATAGIEGMGRSRQTEPPLPPSFLLECFTVGDNSGALLWRQRPASHFPERVEDRANFNARFAGKPAGFEINGETFVRVQWRGKTRRISALRAAWILATGSYPAGVVEARDGDRSNMRPENLIERNRDWRRVGGPSSESPRTRRRTR